MTSLILLFKQLNAGWVKVKSTDTRTTSIDVVLLSMFLTLYKYVQCFCMFWYTKPTGKTFPKFVITTLEQDFQNCDFH